MFKVNDTVLYGSYSVCTITDIVSREFGGSPTDYYILKPVYDDKSTVFVPVKNDVLVSRMHKVLTADEIRELISTIPEEKSDWIENENERRTRYSEILHNGDRRELIGMIKSLYENREQLKEHKKRQHLSDERFFRDAEKLLYEEFAHVLDIRRDQVLPFILESIHTDQES